MACEHHHSAASAFGVHQSKTRALETPRSSLQKYSGRQSSPKELVWGALGSCAVWGAAIVPACGMELHWLGRELNHGEEYYRFWPKLAMRERGREGQQLLGKHAQPSTWICPQMAPGTGGDGRVHSMVLPGPVLPTLSCAKMCVLSISTAVLSFSHWMSTDFALGFQDIEGAGLALIAA